jgi:NAD(P)-dependent dehydrogenase (short-subunit alcohol dehydrogenase family)
MPRVAVVTGAANGIGRALTAVLLGDGWSVTGVDRDVEGLDRLPGDERFEAVAGDVRDTAVLRRAREAAEAAGELSAWVNNAGIVRLAPLHAMDLVTVDEVLDVDLRAVVVGTREALRSFLDHAVAGSIVNVSSIHGRGAFPGYGAYDVAKAGVESLTRYVCVEYGHLGIRCNAVAPGAVRTGIVTPASGAAGPPMPSDVALAPMRRASEPEEIATAIRYLLSSTALAVNGHTLAVDNGMSARVFAFEPDPSVRFPNSPI